MLFKRVVGGDAVEDTVQLDSVGLTVELHDLKGHFQPRLFWFCEL